MTDARFCRLEDRGVLALTGEDGVSFLQGIVTNDVEPLAEERAIYSALLTPQGKYLHDFFLMRFADRLLIDVAAGRKDDLMRRLAMYRLRAKVEMSDLGDAIEVFAIFGPDAPQAASLESVAGAARPLDGGTIYVDPRHAGLGLRAALPAGTGDAMLSALGASPAGRAEYDALRCALGIADGGRDLAPEAVFPLEAGFAELNGISFSKGCFVGQEVTIRMKNRRLVRKRIVPVGIDGATARAGSEVRLEDVVVGELFAAGDGTGLALIRLDALEKALETGTPLSSGDARLTPRKPDWADF